MGEGSVSGGVALWIRARFEEGSKGWEGEDGPRLERAGGLEVLEFEENSTWDI